MVVDRLQSAHEMNTMGREEDSAAGSATSPAYPDTHAKELFTTVARYLARAVSELRPKVTVESLLKMHDYYDREICPPIDYDEFAEAFTLQYFLTNYLKTISVLTEEPPPLGESVLDLGAGSGAAVLACLSMLDSRAIGPHQVDVCLVDRSSRQLELAETLMKGAQKYFRKLRLRVRYEVADIRTWCNPERGDIVLSSHLITENHAHADQLLKRAMNLTLDGGRLYLIERSDDSIWRVIDQQLDGLLPWRKGRVNDAAGLNSDYLTCRFPRERLVQVVNDYFRAWRDRNPDALAAIFSPNALYVANPWKEPLRGLEEVVRYWRREVVPQVDPRPQVLKTAYSDDSVFVEWNTSFHRDGLNSALSGAMIIQIDHSTGLILSLREWFRRDRSGTS